MIKSSIVEQKSGQELYIASQNGYKILISETHAQVAGVFKAKTLIAAGTVIVAEPDADGSIVLTDLILTSDKTQSSAITVQFTDGTETTVLVEADITDAPCNIATSFAGQWRGWRDARLELVITGGINPTATLAVGYYKLQDSLLYSDWDSRR
jgi:hypothetical protein